MVGYKGGQEEETVSGRKKRKAEEQEVFWAVWVYLTSSPACEQQHLDRDKKTTDHLTKLSA